MTPVTPIVPPPVVLGNKNRREYHDAYGRRLRVGDFVSYTTARSSSIYQNIGRIAEFKDLDRPAYLGSVPRPDDGGPPWRRVESWNVAFTVKIVPYEFDRVTKKLTPGTGNHVQPTDEKDVKKRTIKAVERLIRLDLDD